MIILHLSKYFRKLVKFTKYHFEFYLSLNTRDRYDLVLCQRVRFNKIVMHVISFCSKRMGSEKTGGEVGRVGKNANFSSRSSIQLVLHERRLNNATKMMAHRVRNVESFKLFEDRVFIRLFDRRRIAGENKFPLILIRWKRR